MKMGKVMALAMAVSGGAMPTVAAAEELHVIATGALQGAMKTLKPAYEKKTGNRLVIVWGPSFGTSPEAIPERIRNKEPMDVTIGTEETLDAVGKAGVFDPASRRVVALSQIGIAVPQGRPHPAIATVDNTESAHIDGNVDIRMGTYTDTVNASPLLVSFNDGQGKVVLATFRVASNASSDMLLILQYMMYSL